MKITSAKFIKGIVGPDKTLDDGIPQIAFIGRSNVGKSSVINSLTDRKALARTSSFPGRTQQINVFLINESFYFLDLPGYGFSGDSREKKDQLQALINWYLFKSHYEQKRVVLIIDAKAGLTDSDIETLQALEEHQKDIVIVANKTDKIRPSKLKERLQEVYDISLCHKVIPYSSVKKTGIKELSREIFD
ncbi:MAG: ribosome biogenesis GTP-binding protein YihA/YsxC [Candidatus Saganbacteria bacterium]|nr:ribosome biogenesis GTP-binding protein YihA/YsxC [Candidatus Saganbacteria bacterium]